MKRTVFVLVHGGAHGAWAFGRLIPHLLHLGHLTIATDLPGHGVHARFPRSYLMRPLDAGAFAAERSPLAHLTLQDFTDDVIATITRASQNWPDSQIVLVGHSMAGLVLHRVGETIPHLIHRIVYLSAWMTANRTPFNDYIFQPEFADAQIMPILIGDPGTTGVLRMDFRSDDPDYRAQTKAAFAADVNDEDWQAIVNLLTPDTPAAAMAEPVTISADRWGRIPRTYISCTADRAVPLAAQQRFIADADQLTPDNPTDVRQIDTSHSPFLSAPDQLATILDQL